MAIMPPHQSPEVLDSPHGNPFTDPPTPSFSTPITFTHALSIKLTRSNYLLWNQQVEGVIIAHKLHRFVVNPLIPVKYALETDKELDLQTAEYQRWLVQDQMLFTWLLSSFSESILPRVIGCKHSWQVWDTIHKHLLPSQGQVSEQDHIDAVLEGLPEEYNPFIMTIYGRVDSVSIFDIESLLLVQEAQLEKFRQDISGIPTINMAQGPNARGNESSECNEGSNSRRGGRGSSNRGRGRGRGGRGGNKPTCQLCFKYGHNAFDCWYRFDQNFIQPPPPPTQPSQGATTTSQAASHVYLAAQHPHHVPATQELQLPSNVWYADSGATHHLTADDRNLAHNAPFIGSNKVLMGNGQGLQISSLGHSKFISPSHPNITLSLHNLLHVPNITKNLVSVSKFARDNNVFFEFHPFSCFVKS